MKILGSIIKWMKMGNVIIFAIAMMAAITVAVVPGGVTKAVAQESGSEEAVEEAHGSAAGAPPSVWGLGLLAAAISTCVSAVAAGVAVSIVGSAAMGAVAEKPEVMGRSIIFVGLAEGIAIYGLIISIMILGKLG